MLVLFKTLGIIVCVLAAIILIAVSALLYYENHDFSDHNGLDKKEYSCYRGDLETRGTVFMPSGQTDVPIAIVCHEFMTNRLFSYPYAMALPKPTKLPERMCAFSSSPAASIFSAVQST